MLGRYASEIRTGCANERPSGSVRGAPGNWCPYRDRHLTDGFLAGCQRRMLQTQHLYVVIATLRW
jgi:hypothetical protein